jgi:hypothetical protein
MNEQEIALSYSQPTTEQPKLKGGSGQAWGAAGAGMCWWSLEVSWVQVEKRRGTVMATVLIRVCYGGGVRTWAGGFVIWGGLGCLCFSCCRVELLLRGQFTVIRHAKGNLLSV